MVRLIVDDISFRRRLELPLKHNHCLNTPGFNSSAYDSNQCWFIVMNVLLIPALFIAIGTLHA